MASKKQSKFNLLKTIQNSNENLGNTLAIYNCAR